MPDAGVQTVVDRVAGSEVTRAEGRDAGVVELNTQAPVSS